MSRNRATCVLMVPVGERSLHLFIFVVIPLSSTQLEVVRYKFIFFPKLLHVFAILEGAVEEQEIKLAVQAQQFPLQHSSSARCRLLKLSRNRSNQMTDVLQ